MKKIALLTTVLALAACGDDALTFEQFQPICESSEGLKLNLSMNVPFNEFGKLNYSNICKCIYETHAKQKTGIITSLYSESIAVINAMAEEGSVSKVSMTKEMALQVQCAK